MYNELWLSTFVVIIDDRREISSIGKGAWVLNVLWESHAGDLNMEWYGSIQRSHHLSEMSPSFFYFLHCYSCFHWLMVINGSPFQYCRYGLHNNNNNRKEFVYRNPRLKIFVFVWKCKHDMAGSSVSWLCLHFSDFTLNLI